MATNDGRPTNAPFRDHGGLQGLSDDDHPNHPFQPGRAGGQAIVGGTAAAEELVLRGSSEAALGKIRLQSPVDFSSIAGSFASGIADLISDNSDWGVVSDPLAGGGLRLGQTVTFTNAGFIYEGVSAAPVITSGVVPFFAAFTLFNAGPQLVQGTDPSFTPLPPIMVNLSPQMRNPNAIAGTFAGATGVRAGCLTKAEAAGGSMSNTGTIRGATFEPTYSTDDAGATVNLGDLVGFATFNPEVGFFQPDVGTTTLTSYVGFDAQEISFPASGDRIGFRSQISHATGKWSYFNASTGRHFFGNGWCFLGDNARFVFGAGEDVGVFWDGVDSLVWQPAGGFAPARFRFQLGLFEIREVSASPATISLRFTRYQFGQSSNGVFAWMTLGPTNGRTAGSPAGYDDVRVFTTGVLDVNGVALDRRATMRVVPAPKILNGGSVADESTLHVDGMLITNSTRVHALRVAGRFRLKGAFNFDAESPTQIVADRNDYPLPTHPNEAFGLRFTTDASRTITGINSAVLGATQTGDAFCLMNVGANDLVLAHQNAGSAAANRFISPTGLNYTLAPDQSAWIWYDETTQRWRILFGSGT